MRPGVPHACLQMQNRGQRVAALAEERATTGSHPVLVRLRVRAAVRLLALHPQDRPARRIEEALGLRRTAARRASSPRNRGGGRAARRRRASRRPIAALPLHPRRAVTSRAAWKQPVSGFSTITCLPAAARDVRTRSCRWFGTPRSTTVTAGSASSCVEASRVGDFEPELGGELRAPARVPAATPRLGNATPGDRREPAMCRRATNPAPAIRPRPQWGPGQTSGHSGMRRVSRIELASRLAGRAASRACRASTCATSPTSSRSGPRRRPAAHRHGRRHLVLARHVDRRTSITTDDGRIVVNTGMWFEAQDAQAQLRRGHAPRRPATSC